MFVVVSTSVDGTLNTHFVQQLTIDAFSRSVVIAERSVRRVEVLKRRHRRQISILIAFKWSNVIRVNVLSAG